MINYAASKTSVLQDSQIGAKDDGYIYSFMRSVDRQLNYTFDIIIRESLGSARETKCGNTHNLRRF